MSTVSFKRSANVNEIPIVDGQLVFDETHNKIYMDNGSERLQYGGDVSLIEDVNYATSNNTFSANGSLDIFTQKLSVIDNKDSALAATEQHVPVGCLAFQSVIGNADYSGVGNTISDSLVTLKNNINSVNGQLTANNNAMYMDYHDGKYGVNTSSTRGADTFIPFNDIEPIYNAIVARGVTPASDSVEDIVAAIAQIDTRHSVYVHWQFAGGDHPDNYSYSWYANVDGVRVAYGNYQVKNDWGATI